MRLIFLCCERNVDSKYKNSYNKSCLSATLRNFFFSLKDDILKELDEKHSSKELMIMDMHNTIDISVNRLNECVKFTERILCNGNKWDFWNKIWEKYLN